MNNVIEPLFELQNLEDKAATQDHDSAIQRLRKKIHPQILIHYDRLRARGKKGVALVRNGVCTECHMRLASGTYATLLRVEDIMICDNCGRYLHLDPSGAKTAEEAAAASVAAKPVKKARARSAKTQPPPG